VQEALVDVAAWAALNNEGTQYVDCHPLPAQVEAVDCSLASVEQRGSSYGATALGGATGEEPQGSCGATRVDLGSCGAAEKDAEVRVC
jgi:hypothetical protein